MLLPQDSWGKENAQGHRLSSASSSPLPTLVHSIMCLSIFWRWKDSPEENASCSVILLSETTEKGKSAKRIHSSESHPANPFGVLCVFLIRYHWGCPHSVEICAFHAYKQSLWPAISSAWLGELVDTIRTANNLYYNITNITIYSSPVGEKVGPFRHSKLVSFCLNTHKLIFFSLILYYGTMVQLVYKEFTWIH